MTPKTEKFCKVYIYYIGWFIGLVGSVLLAIAGNLNASNNYLITAIIFHAIAHIRGDILEMKRSKND